MTLEDELSGLRFIIKQMEQRDAKKDIAIKKALKSIEDMVDTITEQSLRLQLTKLLLSKTLNLPLGEQVSDDKIMDHNIT